MSRRKVYEMAFELQGKINSTFKGAFMNANTQLQRLDQSTRQLRAGLKNLDNAYAQGEISVQQYQKHQRLLQEQLERTYAAQKRLYDLQNRRSNIKQQNDEIGGKVASTAATAAPLVGLVMASDRYADAQKQIRIQTNLTAQQSKKAWNVVRAAHLSGLGDSVQSTAYSYGLMSQIIKGETAQQQQTILQGTLAVEKYWQEGPEAVSRAVHNLTSNYKNLSKIQAMDIITAGFQNGLNYAGDYLDTLYEYSPQFEDMGYSAKQFYAILAAGKNAGAFNLDKVADAVKEFNIRAQDGSKTTAEGFAMIGLDAEKMEQAVASGGDEGVKALNQTIQALNKIDDPVKRNQAGVALFGTQWEDLTEKVILSMNVMDEAANNIDGATKKVVDAATKAKDGTVTWSQLGRQIQDTAAVVGDSLLPVISPMVQWLNSSALAVANFAEKHPGLTRAITTGATALIGLRLATLGARFAWNQLKMTGIGLKTAIQGIKNAHLLARTQTILATGATKGLTLAQKALNLVMKGNPYLRVALLIGGLVTAGIALYKNWDTVKLKASQLWETISNVFKSGVNKAIDWINALIEKINLIPGINIKTIDKLPVTNKSKGVSPIAYAYGGFATHPQIATVAERVPEAIIPLDGSRRSVSLWEKTGQLLGAGCGGTVIKIDAPFSPTISGGSVDSQALRDLQKSYMAELEDTIRRVMRDVSHNNTRVAFG